MKYQRNKFRTALEIIREIKNWPTALSMRFFRKTPGLRLLNFRNGLNIVCRQDTRDWDVIHELFFAGSYQRALRYLGEQAGEPAVLDLGGNIGLFSLLAARSHPQARVITYEPGPPNYRLFQMNRLANPELGERIELRKAAVAGYERTANWFFDAENPGGSGLFGETGESYPVEIKAFADVVSAIDRPISLAKIDIEGSEYEVLQHTPPEIWRRVGAISLELHQSASQPAAFQEFLERMKSYGYTIEEESVCSYFLTRA